MTNVFRATFVSAIVLSAVGALIALGACHTAPRPILRHATLGRAELLGPQQTPADGRWLAVHEYAQVEAPGVTILVSGLGVDAAVWDLPPGRGLAAALWRAGYHVYAIEHRGTGASSPAPPSFDLAKLGADLEPALRAIARRHRGAAIFGIGHGIGGTALLRAATADVIDLAGFVGISVPLAFGGGTRAFAALRNAPQQLRRPSVDWKYLAGRPLLPSSAFDGGSTRMLVTTGLPPARLGAFYDRALAPMPSSLLASLVATQPGPVPERSALVDALATATDLDLLIITSPSDGLAPPWQCDPEAFGLRRNNIERIYLTRANGTAVEYNHYDALLHPAAQDDVYPPLIDWLDARTP